MSRREAREKAMQVIFQVDVGRADPEEALRRTLGEGALDEASAAFARELVRGTVAYLKEIDGWIKRFTVDWDLERLAGVDRSILRLAIYELLYGEDTPSSVAINEAIELAKTFNSEESGRFVNGLLDSVRLQLEERSPGG